MYQLCSFATFATFATLRSIKIASFGNFWGASLLIGMPNIARIGETVTQVLYTEANKSFNWQKCAVIS